MTIEKNPINGAWQVSDMIGDHFVSAQYFHYTRAEAIAEFKAEFLPTKGETT